MIATVITDRSVALVFALVWTFFLALGTDALRAIARSAKRKESK